MPDPESIIEQRHRLAFALRDDWRRGWRDMLGRHARRRAPHAAFFAHFACAHRAQRNRGRFRCNGRGCVRRFIDPGERRLYATRRLPDRRRGHGARFLVLGLAGAKPQPNPIRPAERRVARTAEFGSGFARCGATCEIAQAIVRKSIPSPEGHSRPYPSTPTRSATASASSSPNETKCSNPSRLTSAANCACDGSISPSVAFNSWKTTRAPGSR